MCTMIQIQRSRMGMNSLVDSIELIEASPCYEHVNTEEVVVFRNYYKRIPGPNNSYAKLMNRTDYNESNTLIKINNYFLFMNNDTIQSVDTCPDNTVVKSPMKDPLRRGHKSHNTNNCPTKDVLQGPKCSFSHNYC